MSRIQELLQNTVEIIQAERGDDYYRYYLRENVPATPRFYAEGVVVVSPDEKGSAIYTAQLAGPDRKPISADEYYEAILQAELPSRVLVKEAAENPMGDGKEVLDTEYQLAFMMAELLNIPMMASVLYRSEKSTELLIEFLSLLPLRPSDGFQRMKARIRERLAR